MRYFMDTEFHEYKKKPLLGKGVDTIELISIGIVSDDKEFYALCKEFNLRAAWNNKWLRTNVLKPIYEEFVEKLRKDMTSHKKSVINDWYVSFITRKFNYRSMKLIFDRFGRTKAQIAKEIVYFVGGFYNEVQGDIGHYKCHTKPEFYAYYADYDWVVFCWLFGRMIDLPEGFPMYCRDLKQYLVDIDPLVCGKDPYIRGKHGGIEFDISRHKRYPAKENGHSALYDARWNKKLYDFIQFLTNKEKNIKPVDSVS